MAFRQPTLPAPRQISVVETEYNAPITVPLARPRTFEDSQEWVLFPQAQARSTTQTQTTCTAGTPRTAGLSRLSDFGSLDTAARSGQYQEETSDVGEDDEDLDSLDEGLHAFQEPSVYRSGQHLDASNSILPTHDGLGTFPASSPPVQEQLWRFEQYNPRKRSAGHQRRRSSVIRRLDAVADADGAAIEVERTERIERWRMEQSRILLEEVEKETRRRRSSQASRRAEKNAAAPEQEKVFVGSNNPSPVVDKQEVPAKNTECPDSEYSVSFWQRITRRVIRDLMGIDDALLSVIFGESLPEEDSGRLSFGPSMPHSIAFDTSGSISRNGGWESRLLDRLAHELGVLVQQLSNHPGAFNTALNPSNLDYAGIPVANTATSQKPPDTSPMTDDEGTNSSPSPHFAPTLQDRSASALESKHAALWGIEEEDPLSASATQDREYWEQAPDLKTVFRFLHQRFLSHRRPSSPSATKKPSNNIATTSTTDSLRRAAIIRQHHPLVSRAIAHQPRRSAAHNLHHHHLHHNSHFHNTNSSSVFSSHHFLRTRPESSCAQSASAARRGRRAGAAGGSGSSSRNYWDLGGSTAGSGSAMAAAGGGMGAWGEV